MIAKSNQDSIEPAADVDLECRIANFLFERRVPLGKSLHLAAHSGTVVASGSVPTARAKWLCMECCRHVAGVIKLVDHIDVEFPKVTWEKA